MGDLTAKSKDEKPTGKKRPREPGRTSTGSQIMGIHLQMILQRLLRMTCGLILCSISWFQILRLRMDWVMMTTREEHGMEMKRMCLMKMKRLKVQRKKVMNESACVLTPTPRQPSLPIYIFIDSLVPIINNRWGHFSK